MPYYSVKWPDGDAPYGRVGQAAYVLLAVLLIYKVYRKLKQW